MTPMTHAEPPVAGNTPAVGTHHRPLADHLAAVIDAVSPIGRAENGATTRWAYSPEERAAHDAVGAFFDERFDQYIDAAGNRWIVLRGLDPDLPPVLTGSHLDTVPSGGAWDGALGVFAGAAALLTLADRDEALLRSIALVIFASEESPRFAQAAYRFGSRSIAGRVHPDDVHRLKDGSGTTLAHAMAALGLHPDRVTEARMPFSDIHALVELHIDQGLTLMRAGAPVSAVSSITGSCRLRLRVRGRADHSGAARMTDRRDALTAAAEVILVVERIALEEESGELVMTVGTVDVEPGSVSVVPGDVVLAVDIRSTSPRIQNAARDELALRIGDIAERRDVTIGIEVIRDVEPIPLSSEIQRVVEGVLARAGLVALSVPSHAGHDTGSFMGHPRLGMIFVRNPSGRSHTPDEHIDFDDAVLGTLVLRETLVQLAKERP